ncbi:MAG: DUF5110 domain-containing protein [Prevotella sp.]|nr:DUF5110 domain-containing protein [Prevotella sp.]
MKSKVLLLAVALLSCGLAIGQAQQVTVGTTDISVTFFTPRTVHIVKHPQGAQPLRPSMVVTARPDEGLSVATKESGSEVAFSSSELTVRVNKTTGRVAFEGRRVKNLLSELSYGFEPRTSGPDKGAYRVSTTFALQKDEPIYGLGTLQDGSLSHRGKRVDMEQSNLQDFQLVFQSIRGWAIYWDNYSRTVFDAKGQNQMLLSSEVGDAVDYYFMLGGSVDGNIGEMRALSGQVPMFPLWTYGYWQSKERYKSSKELLDVLHRYRKEQVPLDGIIQDWQYWGSNYTWNAMDFLHDDFLNGKKMINEVHRQKAHFMISIWASFGPMTQQYRELDSLGLLYDFQTWPQIGLSPWPPRMDYPSGVRVYDAFSPKAREIYWRHLTRLLNAGTDAWWMDSTDPDCFYPKDKDYDHSAGDGTWRRYRNAFPLATVGGVYDGQRRTTSDKRVFIMTRSAFAGQQRYGSGLWSGDVRSSWEVLRQQIPLGLNYSMTGCPNFNTDIGGFFASGYATHGRGTQPRNPQYQELYVRWMQYGLFCPVFRSHGTDCGREIWEFGRPGEAVYDAIAKQIRFRYRLIPYLYSTAWQATSGNGSYMRPLFADFAADRRTWEEAHEFMFGNSILAAPIVTAQYTPEAIDRSKPKDGKLDSQGLDGWSVTSAATTDEGFPVVDFSAAKTATKYLPKGTTWYDFWTGRQYKGGQNVTIETRLDRVPMFVRAGSIVPLGPEEQYVGEKAWDNLELRVYPGADGQFTLYEDEGDNYNYEKGRYTTITMTWNNARRTLVIGERSGQYDGMLAKRQFTIVLPDGTSQTINYDGQELSVKL